MNTTLEDNTKQPSTTDASLYNGQPIGATPTCHSASPISCTPPISLTKDGVSVENVFNTDKLWFVLRVSYGRIVKAQTLFKEKGIENYIPLRYKQTKKRGKKHIITEPLLPSFAFVHTTYDQLKYLLASSTTDVPISRPILSIYYDHTSFRKDAHSKNPPLIIPDSAMDNFIRATSTKSPHVIHVTSKDIGYKLGDNVLITEGDFIGVHGRVARIAGQQRVVVELFDGCLVATAYVPRGAMKIYTNTQIHN